MSVFLSFPPSEGVGSDGLVVCGVPLVLIIEKCCPWRRYWSIPSDTALWRICSQIHSNLRERPSMVYRVRSIALNARIGLVPWLSTVLSLGGPINLLWVEPDS